VTEQRKKLITQWFPCAAVDKAVGTPEGSGLSEKGLFTWFAARPVAQARAAVLTALLPDDENIRPLVECAIQGDMNSLRQLASRIQQDYPDGRPVLLDMFSGRGMIPLEAARLGFPAVGLDNSPVATLAGRLLGDYPFRPWENEALLPFSHGQVGGQQLDVGADAPRLISDVRDLLAEIGERIAVAVGPHYPLAADGTYPWGYLWAITIPCDGCSRRFPLVGSFVLRYPYRRTGDAGQAFSIAIDSDGESWRVEIYDGAPVQAPIIGSTGGKRGKSARCPFCQKPHSLDTVKAKGTQGQFEDYPLLAADNQGEAKKTFRSLRADELAAALRARPSRLETFGSLRAVPDEPIPEGNRDTVRASGYGYSTYGDLMNERQTLLFVETVRAMRMCHTEMLGAGLSPAYACALTSYAAASLVRKIRRSTRGAKLQAMGNSDGTGQNRNKVIDIFSDESKVSFSFDFFETGPGRGPATWVSIAQTGTQVLEKHLRHLDGRPAKFRQGSAMALPFRDSSVDAVVTDPPYYNMIDYSDASDLFYVWLKRALFDVHPDLFDARGLQDKTDEIIVKRGNAPGEHRTEQFYQDSLARAFAEARRVLRDDGSLVVIFGHSDRDAWRRLLQAIADAGFIVTSTWPSRTESGNTGVASIKVTVTIGCRVAPATRPMTTVVQADREVVDLIKKRVPHWERWGLALTDQLMAACGPAMEVYGRYSKILQPDNTVAPLDRYLTMARVAVRDATAMRVDTIPLETFDPITRFAIFWMRLYGRGNVNKGEALFLAEADHLRLNDIRKGLLEESKAGFKVTLDPPEKITEFSPVFDVVRAMTAAWPNGVDAVAESMVQSGRTPEDEHLWAVVGELARLLPASDQDAKALAAIQRNRAVVVQSVKMLSGAVKRGSQQLLLLGDAAD